MAFALSGQSPQQNAKPASDQQTKTAKKPTPLKQQAATSGGEQRGCPGTRFPRVPCDAITAEATLQQIDVAQQANWLGLVTALVAGIAAFFAWRAARAATKSYKAFVAAEDAHLAIEFTNGTWVESVVEGVPQPTTYCLTVVITNIGRSTARVRYCTVNALDSERLKIDKTLRKDETAELGWQIMLESLDMFKFIINYASPIRSEAYLVVAAEPQLTQDRRRLIANVLRTDLVDFGDIELG